jgi:hypothetical protein
MIGYFSLSSSSKVSDLLFLKRLMRRRRAIDIGMKLFGADDG